MGELRQQLHKLLRKNIRPEYLNRIDEIVLFKPLLKSRNKKDCRSAARTCTKNVKG